MTNSLDFFDLVPGTIGTLLYKKNMLLGMPESAKQDYVSRASNERMRMFINNMTYGMNGNGPTDPFDAFIKARGDSWNDLENGVVGIEHTELHVQVGQKESYEVMLKIESCDDFCGWLDPVFVEMFKSQFNENTSS